MIYYFFLSFFSFLLFLFLLFFFFFFNDTATTEIYTLSLHDALPICHPASARAARRGWDGRCPRPRAAGPRAAARRLARASRRPTQGIAQGALAARHSSTIASWC